MNVKTTRGIAEFVCNSTIDDIDRKVVEYAKVLALSHIGMTIAGATMDFGEKVIRYVQQKGGAQEARSLCLEGSPGRRLGGRAERSLERTHRRAGDFTG